MNDLVFNQPIETGTIRAEFFGDTEKAKGYITASRKLLGSVRTIYGVNQRIADGEAGGYYRHFAQLQDGTQIEVLTNNGMDTVRIYAVPVVELIKPVVEEEIDTTTTEEIPVLQTYDEGGVDFTIWLIFKSTVKYDVTLKEWSFSNGFTGKSILIPENPNYCEALVMFNGWVWGVHYKSATQEQLFRVNIDTGIEESLYLHASTEAAQSATTITPLGVLFVVGRIGASVILLDADGALVYDTPLNSGYNGWVGGSIHSFINNGTTAYLHYGDTASSLRGMAIIDVATGANTTISLSASTFDTPDDYRLGRGAFAVLSGDSMYGVRLRANDAPPYQPSEVFLRDPSSSISSATLADISDYFPSEDNEGFSKIKYGAATVVDDGLVVVSSSKDVVVIDPATKSVVNQYTVAGLWGLPFDTLNGNTPILSKGCSILPDSGLAALFFSYDNASHLVTLNPVTGETTKDSFDRAYGYLIQVEINAAANPDPNASPLKEEWEYLSVTNVNPL
jgi:hypothetical protein